MTIYEIAGIIVLVFVIAGVALWISDVRWRRRMKSMMTKILKEKESDDEIRDKV